MFNSLKNSPVLWVGVAAVVYGVFLIVTGGVTLKALVAVGAGAYFVSQKVSPVVLNKVKTAIANKVKDIFLELVTPDVAEAKVMPEPPVATRVDTEPVPAVKSVNISDKSFTNYFNPEDYAAITYLATQAQKAGDDKAVTDLQSLNNQFFNIALNRVKTEDKTNEKPAQ